MAALVSLAQPLTATAQSCAQSGTVSPQPAWVNGAGVDEPTHLYAAGVAEMKAGTPLESARDAARARALSELGQQIQAEVRSRLSESLEKVSSNGRARVNESFTASTEVQSRLSLRSVQVVEQWLDTAGCRLWLRVRVPKADAERARQAATSDAAVAGLREQLALAADVRRPLAERQVALAEARELARLADPALTPGFSRQGFELQQGELDGQLGGLRDRESQYSAALTRHTQAMGQASASPAGPARRAALNRALTALESALTLAPAGLAGVPLPFAPEERMATLHAELGARCVGRQWFERRNLALPAALSAGSACEPAQLARERRSLFLDGKTVALDCTLVIGGARSAWAKACGLLQSSLSADGAQIAAPGGSADLRIELSAEGAVQERKDSEQVRAGWRFQGKLRATARAAGQLDLSDDYEGLTGWNPISAQMATDLLALSAVKRFETALNAFWEKR